MTLKESIYAHCLAAVSAKTEALLATLADLKESASNETKSTAGDKHETALAMLQIEQKNVSGQLDNWQNQLRLLKSLSPWKQASPVSNGCLVKTDRGYLYLSISLGKFTADGVEVIALSAQSPLGRLILGKREGDRVVLNGIAYLLQTVE